jgi:hypothetical protein
MFDVWVELVCANCSETTGGQHIYTQSVPRRKMWESAKSLGWVKGGNQNEEMFCCESCKRQYDSSPIHVPVTRAASQLT